MKPLTKPQRELLGIIVATTSRRGYEPYGHDWPSVKRLKREGLIERTSSIIGGYRATQLGIETAGASK